MKVYLGDGVYAEHDGFAVTLTTENGIEVTNTIVLEPEVYRELARLFAIVSGDARPVQPDAEGDKR